ncbi:hypothetical protein ACIQMR_33380 [Streptomyces sp. NPDC091376]|uniref:hypothetical protein n=1 Tax=Streptomyces sp. NPDC091376 TaxID=3365994 RepID=UPI003809E897
MEIPSRLLAPEWTSLYTQDALVQLKLVDSVYQLPGLLPGLGDEGGYAELFSEACVSGLWPNGTPHQTDVKDLWSRFLYGAAGLDELQRGLASPSPEVHDIEGEWHRALHQELVAVFEWHVHQTACKRAAAAWVDQASWLTPEEAISLAKIIADPALFEQTLRKDADSRVEKLVHNISAKELKPHERAEIANELLARNPQQGNLCGTGNPAAGADLKLAVDDALKRPERSRILIPEDLTTAPYASLYTPQHLYVLGDDESSFPRQEPFIGDEGNRGRLRYVYKRYLYECIHPVLSSRGLFVERDEFCDRPYDYPGLCKMIGQAEGEKFFAVVKSSFVAAFSDQVREQKRISSLRDEGDVPSLAEYCRRRLNEAEIKLLIDVLKTDRYFDVIHFAAKNGVYGEEALRGDWEAKGPVSKYFRKKLRNGDKVLPFFAWDGLVGVVKELGDRKKGSRVRQTLAAELSRPGA